MIKNFTKTYLLAFTLLFCININAQIFSEDFDGGIPAGWTVSQMDGSSVNASSNWIYSTDGPQGAFSIGAITSTTAANGFMLFDSDLNCEGPQDVWLISPSFDATAFDDVVVSFEHYYRRFNDQIFLEVSVDGGTNWTEYELYPDLVNNDFAGSENPVVYPALAFLDTSSILSLLSWSTVKAIIHTFFPSTSASIPRSIFTHSLSEKFFKSVLINLSNEIPKKAPNFMRFSRLGSATPFSYPL